MTYTEEFTPDSEQDFSEEAPAYPTVFGITFTPMIGGAILAVVGLLGAAYLMVNQVMPTLQKNQELQSKVNEVETQIQQKKDNPQKIKVAQAKLEASKQQQKDVLGLFANEKTLDTLLLDINSFVNARQGQLISFVPDVTPPTPSTPGVKTVPNVVNDNSLGPDLNNQLRRKSITVQIEGSFDQTESILRSIERLQQLLLIKDLKAELDKSKQKILIDKQGKIVSTVKPMTNIKTSFKLQVLIPVTPEEAAIIASQPVKK